MPQPAATGPSAAAPRARACRDDADCGYHPDGDACDADPRLNRQPLLVDQGIVCFCEAGLCETLRVPPVPCESDRSCAVRPDPRPHRVRASAAHPHERGRPCEDFPASRRRASARTSARCAATTAAGVDRALSQRAAFSRASTKSASVVFIATRLNGFSMTGFDTVARNSRTFAVKMPPVMKMNRSRSAGNAVRVAS